MRDLITLFVDKLTIVDYAYFDSVIGRPVGDTVYANVKVLGTLDKEGVVFDFSLCKKAIKRVIDEQIDHKLVVPRGMAETNEEYGLIKDLGFVQNYSYPVQAVTELESDIANYASMSNHLQNTIMKELKEKLEMENVVAIEVDLIPEEVEGASYRYTHGLKDHYGNCQRLIHGHRSPVRVYIDEVRVREAEEELAKLVHNKHFVFKETRSISDNANNIVQYTSSQGEFSCEILNDQDLIIMDVETTVENIAKFFAVYLRSSYQNDDQIGQIVVQAYEGIEKGAIATA